MTIEVIKPSNNDLAIELSVSEDRSIARGSSLSDDGEESAFRNSPARARERGRKDCADHRATAAILVLTKLLLLGRRDSDRVKVSAARAHVSTDFLGCFYARSPSPPLPSPRRRHRRVRRFVHRDFVPRRADHLSYEREMLHRSRKNRAIERVISSLKPG